MEALTSSLTHGDCIAGMNALPEGSVDLVFADPPFNIGYEYDVYDDVKERDEYLDWSRKWISAAHRALKPDGTFWLAIGDEYAAELKILSQEIGFHCRSWVIWYYTFGVNCKSKFSRSHAHLFHFVKDRKKFTFRSEELENRIPSARQLVYADSRANPHGRLPDDTWILRPQDLADCFTAGEDTWYFPRVAGTFKERAGFHGCQMPEQLLGRIIRLCSHENEVVLDPFAGSSTTLVVARKLGRRYKGFELSSDYASRGKHRLENVRVGDPLEGSPEPTVSAPATPRSGQPGRKSRHKGSPTNSSDAIEAAELPLLQAGLLNAFRRVSDGYSPDRVIADPDLNAELVAECRRLGLQGDARSWNMLLFRMRKAGKLADVPTLKRTEISWENCDDFLFASEIALRQILDEGIASLDQILCDPPTAARFDRIAQSFAPGYSPFEYRWAALKLRKEAKLVRSRADALMTGPLSAPIDVRPKMLKEVADSPAVYLVLGEKGNRCLYAGETLNLRNRLEKQFTKTPLKRWTEYSEDLHVRFFNADGTTTDLLAYQSLLIAKHRPELNLRDLAAL